ncbi:MAG TPA: hypothetical protein VGN91_17370 [Bosea sp. (in: a-proteobacteria)]|jgi:hypothetical protein|nr:hypothetical protein [Bosea sp. (in: a-proteobacteria)]
MSHHSPELVNQVVPLSYRAPPSGKALRERFLLQMNEDDMLNALGRLSGRSVGSVAWLLRQDMIVPGGLLRAAIQLDRQNQARLSHEPISLRVTDRLFGRVRDEPR